MSFLEWVGLFSIVIWLFIGLLYTFKYADDKRKKVSEDTYNKWE